MRTQFRTSVYKENCFVLFLFHANNDFPCIISVNSKPPQRQRGNATTNKKEKHASTRQSFIRRWTIHILIIETYNNYIYCASYMTVSHSALLLKQAILGLSHMHTNVYINLGFTEDIRIVNGLSVHDRQS